MTEGTKETAEGPRRLAEWKAAAQAAAKERDEYRAAYVALLESYRKLEAGLAGPKRERFVGGEEQLSLSVLSMLTSGAQPPAPQPEVEEQQVGAHTRKKPTGRKPLPEKLPRVHVEVLPLEVQRGGLDAFERIGEDVSEVVEHRHASLVVVRTVRGKFVSKAELDRLADIPIPADAKPDESFGSTPVLQAPALDLPIPRALCGPGLLADTVVKRFEDHLPLHRLERIYGREGLELPRSTVCGWHFEASKLLGPLIDAMWNDALANSPYLCTDATGVLVQAKEKCRRGHFFVVVAPGKHVLFDYQPRHDSAAVDDILAGYQGFLVADAHAVYNHLYETGDVVEVACWAHARRYLFKALDSDGARARHGLSLVQALFLKEREYATSPPELKLKRRTVEARPLVEAFFRWCDDEAASVLDETPIAKAIGYARNQRVALCRFLTDGRLPIHNNHSENALRREALGRKNWLFLGSDEGGDVNATFVSLLASCRLHGLEPVSYLRDLLCLAPDWPVRQVLDLAPVNFAKTTARPDVAARLHENVFRRAALGDLSPTPSAISSPPATT